MGGAIALAVAGCLTLPSTTTGTYRGWIGSDGVPCAAICPQQAGSAG